MSDPISWNSMFNCRGWPRRLVAAIRIKQLAQSTSTEVSVCVLEKGTAVGYIYFLARLSTHARFPSQFQTERTWRATQYDRGRRQVCFTEKSSYRLPTPPQMNNHGNYIVSVGALCRWLGEQAEALGVEIYPGFEGKITLDQRNEILGCHRRRRWS